MFFHWKYKKELYFCKEFANSKKIMIIIQIIH